jgi:hypothetical protein
MRRDHPPSRITTRQQRQSQQRPTKATARLRIDAERFRVRVFRIQVNERRTQRENQKNMRVGIVGQRQPERAGQRV